MKTKVCLECSKTLGVKKFSKNKCRKDGLQIYCKRCMGIRNKEYESKNKLKIRNNKKEYMIKNRLKLQRYKADHGCERCGENDYFALDFHHRNKKTKKDSINNLVSSRLFQQVWEEIKKCNLLCANCHKRIHYLESQ